MEFFIANQEVEAEAEAEESEVEVKAGLEAGLIVTLLVKTGGDQVAAVAAVASSGFLIDKKSASVDQISAFIDSPCRVCFEIYNYRPHGINTRRSWCIG